jgi:hypothetical protein
MKWYGGIQIVFFYKMIDSVLSDMPKLIENETTSEQKANLLLSK